MALAKVTQKLREEATCTICLGLMTEPVTIVCGHNYCLICIVGLIEKQSSGASFQGTLRCPQCWKPFKCDDILQPNKQLENIIDTIKETNQERLCEEHGERLQLFCEDDGQLICLFCERAVRHRGHVIVLVEDACQGYRNLLQGTLANLEQAKFRYNLLKISTTLNIRSWEEKVKQEKERIHSEFTYLHTLLHQEEEFYMSSLEKEKVQKLGRLDGNVAYLENKLQELRNHITELSKKCQSSAQDLLQDVKGTLSRSSAIRMETPNDVPLDLRTVCNVSDFICSIMKRIKRFQVNVTLDPNTASNVLRVSDNQKTVSHRTASRIVHRVLGEFTALPCVLGRERFTSGRHYFEVDVEKATEWDVGVCLENGPKESMMHLSMIWTIAMRRNQNYLASSSPPTPLALRDHPKVVGIILDCDAGLVSFYNATTGSHIYTFPKASFPHAVRPYFCLHGLFSSLSLSSSNE